MRYRIPLFRPHKNRNGEQTFIPFRGFNIEFNDWTDFKDEIKNMNEKFIFENGEQGLLFPPSNARRIDDINQTYLLMLDCDAENGDLFEAERKLAKLGISFGINTTKSAKRYNRYRITIPLQTPLCGRYADIEPQYYQAAISLQTYIGQNFDKSKLRPASIFYVPCRFLTQGVDHYFAIHDGHVPEIEFLQKWYNRFTDTDYINRLIWRQQAKREAVTSKDPQELPSPQDATPKLNSYVDEFTSQNGPGSYAAFYRYLHRVLGYARVAGYHCDIDKLREWGYHAANQNSYYMLKHGTKVVDRDVESAFRKGLTS